MDFIIVVVVFGVFFLGLVLLVQGFVRKDPVSRLDLDPYLRRFAQRTQGLPPPERHPIRLMLIGAGLIGLSVVLAILFVA
jgi:hypothetical protein